MSHEVINFEGNTTRYDDEPQITFITKSNELPKINISYKFLSDSGEKSVKEISFFDVIEFHWIEADNDFNHDQKDDFKHCLVKIVDSHRIQELRSFRPEINIELFEHYRIAFDDHGCYDIICAKIEIK